MEEPVLDIIQRLTISLDQLTRSKRVVAEYILNNTMEVAFSTVDKIAHAIGVSTTTVVRLAISLGYSGYAEMQSALKDYVTSTSIPAHSIGRLQTQDTNHAAVRDNASLLEREIQNLRDTCSLLVPETIEKAVAALGAARGIYVIGERNYEGAARFLSYNLDRMFLNAQYVSSNYSHIPEKVNHMTSQDVMIYFSFGRYLKQIGDLVQAAKRNGLLVIGISDSMNSPWAPFTDYTIICANQSVNFFHSPQGAIFVANVLLNQCALKYGDRIEENIKKQDQTSQGLSMFMKK